MLCILERVVLAPNGEVREYRRIGELHVDSVGNAYRTALEDSTSYNIGKVTDFENAVALWLVGALNEQFPAN